MFARVCLKDALNISCKAKSWLFGARLIMVIVW